jgi:hypothetical protein
MNLTSANMGVQLEEIMNKYRIPPKYIINIDEKGFLIGRIGKAKRVMTRQEFETKKIRGVKQDGSREWISFLGGATAAGVRLSPAIIFQGESGHVIDSWIESFDTQDRAIFAATESGWINSDLALEWIQQIVEPETRPEFNSQWRLLLLDGHSTHITRKMIEFCEGCQIILGLLPSHSTHRLQPLDVGIFGPLATGYSKQLSQWLEKQPLGGSFSKRDFWPLFKNSWEVAFSEVNLKSAFQSTGIHPFNPKVVLSKIQKQDVKIQEPEAKSQLLPNVDDASKFARNTKKEYLQFSDNKISNLCDLVDKMALENQVLKHENESLRQTVLRERKQKTRSKPLLVPGMEGQGKGHFLSPSKIERARQEFQNIEAQKEREAEEKKEKQLERQKNRELKAIEVEEKKRERERVKVARLQMKEQMEREKHDRMLKRVQEKEDNEQAKKSKTELLKRKIGNSVRRSEIRRISSHAQEMIVSSRGRVIKRTARVLEQ